MKLVGENLERLAAGIDAALAELMALFARDPGSWRRGCARGSCPRGPGAGCCRRCSCGSWWWEAGCRAAGGRPNRSIRRRRRSLARWPSGSRFAAARHRTLAAGLTADQRDRLWIPNPFLPRWHYTLPESLRVHAVHARHHARQVEEIAAAAQRVS